MRQLLEGLSHLEKHGILHRDLKPANILLNKLGVLKIIDFGLSRRTKDMQYIKEEFRQFTHQVTTPLYRAPEMFLEEKLYSSKVDVWAAGCIFFELLTRKPLLPTEDGDLGVFKGMLKLFGVPDETSWPGVNKLQKFRGVANFLKQERVQVKGLKTHFAQCNYNASPACVDFVSKLLVMCPEKRFSASEALDHPYLTQVDPVPCQPNELPRFESDISQKSARNLINKSKTNSKPSQM